jgi:hypothetical protein
MKYNFNNRFFSIHLEDPGIISPGPCWVLFYGMYAHYNASLFGLLWEVITEFKSDKHLVM